MGTRVPMPNSEVKNGYKSNQQRGYKATMQPICTPQAPYSILMQLGPDTAHQGLIGAAVVAILALSWNFWKQSIAHSGVLHSLHSVVVVFSCINKHIQWVWNTYTHATKDKHADNQQDTGICLAGSGTVCVCVSCVCGCKCTHTYTHT